MSKNYAVINGKRVELTDEQLKALGIETRKNPFKRVDIGDTYRFITAFNAIDEYTDYDDGEDRKLLDLCNYFNDEQFANQVALHQLLYRKLLKFAYDNGIEDTAELDCNNKHHYIFYSYERGAFGAKSDCSTKTQAVYFSTIDDALQAIKEVVKPFMKEHPEFVW